MSRTRTSDPVLDALVDELVDNQHTIAATPRERALAKEVLRLRHECKRLQSQHDFAFASWQQAVKRSGRLSAELEASTIARAQTVPVPRAQGSGSYIFGEFAAPEVHDARTISNAGAAIPPRFDEESAGTRVFRHAGWALVIRQKGSR